MISINKWLSYDQIEWVLENDVVNLFIMMECCIFEHGAYVEMALLWQYHKNNISVEREKEEQNNMIDFYIIDKPKHKSLKTPACMEWKCLF